MILIEHTPPPYTLYLIFESPYDFKSNGCMHCTSFFHHIKGKTILIRYNGGNLGTVIDRGKNIFNACLSVAGSIYEDCCNRFRSGAIWSFSNRLHWRTKSYKFWQFSGRGLKPDPKPKFFMQLWYQGLKISLPNENECSTLKNKNFKILIILGRGLKWDPPNQNFSTYMVSEPWNLHTV